jgi:hypothetical protein
MQVDELRQARALAEENGRLKRIVADLTVQIDILKAINAKKMVSPASKRRAARYAMQSGLGGIAQVCRALEACTVGLLPGGKSQRGGEASTSSHRAAEP